MEPILTCLVTGVGTAIAKGALKRWLKDYPEALGATGAVVDVVGTVAKGLIDRRRGARQFEDIAEKVAQDAFEVVELTGIELSSTQQRVVVDVAGEVLNRCVSDPEFGASLLAQHSLEPSQLSAWFNQHTLPPVPEGAAPPDDPTRGFDDDQKTLYNRLLYDAAQYIVDLGSQFPSFTEKTLSEVLQRQDQITGKADMILEEVGRIRASLQDDSATEAAFEEKYRRAVIRRLDELQLFGVDVASTSKRYRLSVAYVTLLVERERTKEKQTKSQKASRGRQPSGLHDDESGSKKDPKADAFGSPDTDDDDEEFDDRETVPVDEALASTERLFVRGPAGSGKTTLLQWVAVMSASRSHTGALAEWNDRVPFFIKLREFAGKELPLPSIFPILIDRVALTESLPNGWVAHQLENGRALVLIDGLDEMSQEQRETVRRWIDSLIEEYPKSRFVVTSRPYAAKEGVQTVEEKQELDDLGESLLQTVKSKRAIHRLATSPLLCAMLCALHRDRVKNLPADRIELYRACIEMFFRRDTERKIALGDYPELGDRQKRTLLGDLAFWLIRNNLTMADEAKTDERLEKSLRSMGDSSAGITGIQMRHLFVERSGILRQPEPGHIDFPHRTFQEYLAAHAAIAESCVGELIENAHRDQWREVLVLATGVASEAEAEQLVLGVIKRADRSKKQRARFHLLAVLCSELAVRFPKDSDVRKLVSDRLQKIVPPNTISESNELAAAGDLVVPFLEYDSSWKSSQLAASVRTLALVGGDGAYSTIAKYRQSCTRAVWEEILGATSHVASPDDLLYVFKTDATRSEFADADFLRTQIMHFELTDVSGLSGLTSLQTLDLSSTRVRDVSVLASLTSLQKLRLFNTPVSDVSALASLTSLRTLYLNNTPVSDVSALATLTSLQTLNLYGTLVSDVSALDSMAERGLKIHRIASR